MSRVAKVVMDCIRADMAQARDDWSPEARKAAAEARKRNSGGGGVKKTSGPEIDPRTGRPKGYDPSKEHNRLSDTDPRTGHPKEEDYLHSIYKKPRRSY